MTLYRVCYTDAALKALKKLDPPIARMIVAWVRKNLEDCENPRAHGRALTANRAGHWRYRIGDYRLLARIDDGTLVILLLVVGHRRSVYE